MFADLDAPSSKRLPQSPATPRPTVPLRREKAKREYQEALVEKFQYVPEVIRIKKHTHVPRAILKAAKLKDTVMGTQRQREQNRRAHSAPGTVPKLKAKVKKVWKVLE